MSKIKKIIVILSMVLVLGVAAVVNIVLLGGGGGDDEDTLQTGNFFMSYRRVRDETRADEIANLDSILALVGDEYASARAEAAQTKLRITELMEKELVIEYVIRSKGYEDAVVSMGIYSDIINVMVKDTEITREDTAVIYGIIIKETNAEAENIHITPV